LFSLDVATAMRISFTPDEIREMTAKDLAILRADFSSTADNPWVDRMAKIIQDLHALGSEADRDPAAVAQLE
jgi:hypothetical protein